MNKIASLFAISGQVFRGELEDAFDTGSSIALRNTSFFNLWWSRTALDYMLLFHVREWMSPGTLKRSERRMKKDYNQEYFKLGGVDLTPSRNIKHGGGFN